MNSHQINGAVIGNGNPSNVGYLVLTTLVRATSTALLTALRYITGATTAVARSISLIGGTVLLTGTTTASATTSIDLTIVSPNAFGAMGSYPAATSTISLITRGPMAAATTGEATSVVTIVARISVLGSTTAVAASSIALTALGTDAPPDRTMVLPFEYREMQVT